MKRFQIDVHSHGLIVKAFYVDDRQHMLEYCKDLAVYDSVWIPKLRRKINKVKAVYATASHDRMSYGFLRYELSAILRHLEARGISGNDVQINNHYPIPGDAIDVNLQPCVAPRDDEQRGVMDFILSNPESPNRVLGLRTGAGKALSLTTPVRVPDGWKFMGDIKIGDKVISRCGVPTPVTGVHPQGLRGMYTVTFSDGREIDADLEHLWSSSTNLVDYQVLTTERLIALLESKEKCYVPLITPENSKVSHLPIPGYLMGVILGHGNLNRGGVIMISTANPTILDYCQHDVNSLSLKFNKQRGGNRYSIATNGGRVNAATRAIRGYDLFRTHKEDMFIPDDYLDGSLDQRLSLIQGLMDSTATIKGGEVIIAKHLSLDVLTGLQYLIRSIGGKATLTKVECGHYHSLTVECDSPEDLFRLPEKSLLAGKSPPMVNGLGIVSIVYKGKEEAQCITVAHPSQLYVVNGFTVTHNTALSLMTVGYYKVRTGLVMGATHIKTWQDSVGWVLGLTDKDYCIIRGRASLEKIIALTKAGQNDYKLIFFSIATLRSFLKDHLATNLHIDGVTPITLFPTLGIGMKIVDESHENINAVVKDAIHTDVARTIYLSATLLSDDTFINNQYEKIYPLADRYKFATNNKHADGISARYYLTDPDGVKYEGSKGYSHVAFEASIIENDDLLDNYFDIVDELVDRYYLSCREDGQKLLIFCATTVMCGLVAEHITTHQEGSGLTIADYVGHHDPSVLYDNDIVVSTPTSAGTGKDIPGLRVAISTVAIGSVQRNRQMLGRLRELKEWPGITPVFIWLTCLSIPAHMKYDKAKMTEQFPAHTKSLSVINLNREL